MFGGILVIWFLINNNFFWAKSSPFINSTHSLQNLSLFLFALDRDRSGLRSRPKSRSRGVFFRSCKSSRVLVSVLIWDFCGNVNDRLWGNEFSVVFVWFCVSVGLLIRAFGDWIGFEFVIFLLVVLVSCLMIYWFWLSGFEIFYFFLRL